MAHCTRRVLAVLVALGATALTGCAGGGGSGGALPVGPATAVPLVYVSDSTGTVYGFPTTANGFVSPTVTLTGSRTGIVGPNAITRDSAGNLYVAEGPVPRIDVFAPGATGNVAPIRSIFGPNTDLADFSSIALDAKNTLYVGAYKQTVQTSPNPLATVNEYAAGASGNVTPLRSFNNSEITSPTATYGPDATFSIVVTPAGLVGATATSSVEIGVPQRGNANVYQGILTVLEFPATSSGTAAPSSAVGSALIEPLLPQLFPYFLNVAVDPIGNFYCGVSYQPYNQTAIQQELVYVVVFPHGSTTTTVPKIMPILVAPGGTNTIAGIAADRTGRMYVLVNNVVTTVTPNRMTWTIYVVGAGAVPDSNGNYAPSATISTSSSGTISTTSSAPATATGITL